MLHSISLVIQEPLVFYSKIAVLAKINLCVNARLYFEINEQYGSQTKELLDTLGFIDTEVIKDIPSPNTVKKYRYFNKSNTNQFDWI